MVTRKTIVDLLSPLSSGQLRVAEVIAGCYGCQFIKSCEVGQEFVAEPKAVAKFLADHSPRSLK